MFAFLLGAAVIAQSVLGQDAVAAWNLKQPEGGAGTWGYRPVEGEETSVNPPAFTWAPEPGAAEYVLEVSHEPEFGVIDYRKDTIQWTAHCPPSPFETGTYFWRYAATNHSGEVSNWSRTHSFQTSADAPVFPQPTMEELAARLPKEHPRLFFRPEDVTHLRELARGRLADRFSALLKSAEELMAHPPDVSEPPRYPEGTEFKGKEWKEMWWGNRARTIAVADGAALLGFVYQLTGDEKYGRAGCTLLLALCTWDPKAATAYEYNDEAAMPLLYMPSRAYSWLYGLLSPDERAQVQNMMKERGRQAFDHLLKRQHLWTPFESHRNRAWHFLGEVAVAFYGDFPEAAVWLDYAMTVFYTTYPVWGGEDGGWHEGVGYWASYMERFVYWVHVVRAAFGIDAFVKPYFREAGYFPLYVTPPGTKTAGFADMGPTTTSQRAATIMAILAAASHNAYWQWYAEQHRAALPDDYLGFLYDAAITRPESRAPSGLPTSRLFQDVGLAVMNTSIIDIEQNVQVQLKSDPYGRTSHGYNSNNAFLLHWKGLPVFVSTGRREIHGSKHHTKWMWETKSDNAILVNGKGQRVHSPEAVGRISSFFTSPEYDVAVGEAEGSYPAMKRFTRRMLFFKPNLLLIHDLLEAKKPATFDWLLHAPGEFKIEGRTASWNGTPGNAEVQFLYPAGLALSQTNAFDPPPAPWSGIDLNEWHLTAETADKAVRQQFLVLVRLGENAPEVVSQVDAEAALAGWDSGKSTYEVRLGWGEFTVKRDDQTRVFHGQ